MHLPGLLSDIEEVAELHKPSSAVFLPQNSNTPPVRPKDVDLYPQMVYNIPTKSRQKKMPMPKTATKRINVTFPVQLLEDLDKYAPPRKRNKVIVAATENYVQKLKLLAVLKETAGAWDDESHPELATPEDIDRWLREIRSGWRSEPLWQEEDNQKHFPMPELQLYE
jgi:hypothetical protein